MKKIIFGASPVEQTGVLVGKYTGMYFPNESGDGYTFVDEKGRAKLVAGVPNGQTPVVVGQTLSITF
jgi:hypothetical protein